ncbi:hypothetical protein ASZ90_011223 [hydrocarbon metagenome]|uniref:Uncharacterized protein n=1 Tax=hydrocarbon metagenome TaxID=938273 RepID=A0A0W8FDZ9_9ZZZZ
MKIDENDRGIMDPADRGGIIMGNPLPLMRPDAMTGGKPCMRQ